jgi:hypothetical protein
MVPVGEDVTRRRKELEVGSALLEINDLFYFIFKFEVEKRKMRDGL